MSPSRKPTVDLFPGSAFPILSSYSRADALDDGALLDVSPTAREAGLRWPVALTCAAWDLCVAVSPAADRAGQDESGRLWDVLWMLRHAIGQAGAGNRQQLVFHVHIVTETEHAVPISLQAHVGPGDDGAPVIAIMLVDES